MLFTLLTVLFLSLWFHRSEKRDAGVWMYGTYATVAFIIYQQLFMASSFAEGFPLIIRDFILIGIVGLVNSLAVARRIPIWLAIVIILGLFIIAYSIPFEPQPRAINEEDVAAEITDANASPDGEYLVELRPGVTPAELTSWAGLNDIGIRQAFTMQQADQTLLDDYYILDTKNANAATEELIIQSDLTAWVEINEKVMVSPETAAPLEEGKNTYGINDPAANQQWIMEALQMPEYYALLSQQKPQKIAKIAILDTGIDAKHEDIRDNYVSTQKKYDNDPRGHGTHCAGIAAAVTNNGIGIASMSGPGKFVEVTSIKVLSGSGMGTQSTIIQGILEAADSGADVISLSLGGISSDRRQRAYNQAISYARRNKAIVLAAAGNSNREASGYAPANTAGIICVSAIDNLMLRAPFSNKVSGVKMAIAAPGSAIYSTMPGDKYAVFSGTSMACPFVAGLIGVLRSLDPELETDAMYEILQASARRTDEVKDLGPIVQPLKALQRVVE